MAATSWPILGVIFQGGRFSLADTLATLPLTRIMLAATPFWIIYMVLVRAYYAHGDTITPAVTGSIMTALCIPMYYWWAVPNGAWAIAALSGLSVSLYVLWLVGIWIRRHGSGAFTGLTGLAARVIFCSLPATAAGWWVSEVCMRSFTLSPILKACVVLMLGSCAFAALFLPLAWQTAPEALEPVLQRLRRRRGTA